MTRTFRTTLLALALTTTPALAECAWAECTIYATNPPIAGPCDDAPVFPVAGINEPTFEDANGMPAPPTSTMDQTWLIQMTCTAALGATQSCEEYPGKTWTFTSDADMHSQSDCRAVATAMARKYHYMSGNDYAYRCIVSDYQLKELPQ